jgi:hypothetical protein
MLGNEGAGWCRCTVHLRKRGQRLDCIFSLDEWTVLASGSLTGCDIGFDLLFEWVSLWKLFVGVDAKLHC